MELFLVLFSSFIAVTWLVFYIYAFIVVYRKYGNKTEFGFLGIVFTIMSLGILLCLMVVYGDSNAFATLN